MNDRWFTNGPDQVRYAGKLDWDRRFIDELGRREVDVVLDVGANSGQYATGLRENGFEGRIVSFEPLSGPYSVLDPATARDPKWECRQSALGDRDGTITMNVAGGTAECSSILPMLDTHRDLLPRAGYVGTEEVTIDRLDSVAPRFLRPDDVAFLKIDVQGFEKQVIAGAAATVREHCVGLQLELSFVPLYEGGMLVDEALELMTSLGFTMAGFAPFFLEIPSGRLLQADGVFFRG